MIPVENRIVCLGILVADVVGRPVQSVPAPGRFVLVEEMGLYTGGCAVNSASALAMLGTQPQEIATQHLRTSLQTFLRLVALVRSLDQMRMNELIAVRDYEELDLFIIDHLMGTC